MNDLKSHTSHIRQSESVKLVKGNIIGLIPDDATHFRAFKDGSIAILKYIDGALHVLTNGKDWFKFKESKRWVQPIGKGV